MAAISRPLVYGSLLIVCVTALWATSPQETPKSAKASSKKTTTAKKSKEPEWRFPEEELAVRFEKPAKPARDVFKPLIAIEGPAALMSEDEELTKLPASLAGGESDWAYTGMVAVDGQKLALLENGSKKQAGYVREGEVWKKSRIVRITMGYIVVQGPDGEEKTVFRYNANAAPKPKPQPEPGFKPLDLSPALRGPIGGLQIQPEGMPPTKISGAPMIEEIKR